jgi:hypothetical protein
MSDRIDPRRPYQVWLDDFNDWPDGERPTFTYRRMSGSEAMDIADLLDESQNPDLTSRQSLKLIFKAARIGLLGWSCQVNLETGEAQQFDVALLERVIDPSEARTLVLKRITHGHLSPEDKKKSAS